MHPDLGRLNVLTINETVYKELLNAIVSAKLPPGAQITTTQLAEQFGVSLMPVREALKKLQAGGFVSVRKNRRIMINELSVADLSELLEIRLKLEGMAATKAVKNCPDETIRELEQLMEGVKSAKSPEEFLEKNKLFHHTIYQKANMPLLQEIINSLWRRLSPYLHIYVSEMPNYKTLKIHYHEGILQGMRERDPKKVTKWLTLDLKKAAELITDVLRAKEKSAGKTELGLTDFNSQRGEAEK
ncbi:MAG: GntR family transcriptional regulator [Deltaproteobacteria bacterium]|nr:GntR family transcriptional regulator [Deltaproteobacteria bacterium]MBW2122134.1 GntR family transcriptional regulator [Deltaproteobacteria bacterium]